MHSEFTGFLLGNLVILPNKMQEINQLRNTSKGRPPGDTGEILEKIKLISGGKMNGSRISSDFFRKFLTHFLSQITANNPLFLTLASPVNIEQLKKIQDPIHHKRAKLIRKQLEKIENFAYHIEKVFVEMTDLMGTFASLFNISCSGDEEMRNTTAMSMLRVFTKKLKKDRDKYLKNHEENVEKFDESEFLELGEFKSEERKKTKFALLR